MIPLVALFLAGCAAPDPVETSTPDPVWSLAGCIIDWSETSLTEYMACRGTLFGDEYDLWERLWGSVDCSGSREKVVRYAYTPEGCETSGAYVIDDLDDLYRYEAQYEAVCDDRGQPVTATDTWTSTTSDGYEYGGEAASEYVNTYDDDGRLVLQHVEETGSYPATSDASWTYDDAGRLVAREVLYASEDDADRFATYTYDQDGLLLTERWSYVDEDPFYYLKTYERDDLDRVIRIAYDDYEDGTLDDAFHYTWVGETPWVATAVADYGNDGLADYENAYSYDCP